jgi:hypothetical protein
MKRLVWLVALAVGSTLATTRLAEAQGRGSLSGGWGGVDLLLHPRVQEELKLTSEQVEKARDLSSKLLDRQRVIFSQLEGLSSEARAMKARELAIELVEDGMKGVEAIVNPEQFARFRQIDLQQRGASALLEPSLANTLRISNEQARQIRPILDHSILMMREALASARGDRRTSSEKIQVVRRETNEKAIALLTEAQKATWNQMTGQPLDLNPAGRTVR